MEILTEFTNDREPYFKTCSSKDDTCPNAGMKMPPIPMQNSEFYGFSEFWYSMEEVLGMGKTHFYLIMDWYNKDGLGELKVSRISCCYW